MVHGRAGLLINSLCNKHGENMDLPQCVLTVLCENSVAGPQGLVGEHGWAIHVGVGDRSILFDTGQGQGILSNSLILDIDLGSLEALVLSHGHYDHTSGLPEVLRRSGSVDVYSHEDCFIERCWQEAGSSRDIGMRFKRSYLESLGAQCKFVTAFTRIFDDMYLTGQVPRVTDFESVDEHMKVRDSTGKYIQDELRDDQSLVIDTNKGLVIILGCAHAGLINILTHVTNHLPGRSIHMVIGGTHLGCASERKFEQTVRELKRFKVERLGAGHCTGPEKAARLFHHFGDAYFFTPVGTRCIC
jgi:7,8-dihydropterin-6-yl-methyl-4-(beta-D-ribofuranosyl)aminobenzene 5'-phosphate synthase